MSARIAERPHLRALGWDHELPTGSLALRLEDGSGAVVAVRDEFDSAVFQRGIAKVVHCHATTPEARAELLAALDDAARQAGYAQLVRRIPLEDRLEHWALSAAGYEQLDVGLTFARGSGNAASRPLHDDGFVVRQAESDDVEAVCAGMAGEPWGSRYEADPSYTPEQIAELRRRWFWNSYHGRAAAFLVGCFGSEVAGYVICLLEDGHGDIDLVGTSPAFRGRRVARRILDHALDWLAPRCTTVRVRTQATNVVAASLYEGAGFRLAGADATLRRRVLEEGVRS